MTVKLTRKEENGALDARGYNGLLAEMVVLVYPLLTFARQHLANWEEGKPRHCLGNLGANRHFPISTSFLPDAPGPGRLAQ